MVTRHRLVTSSHLLQYLHRLSAEFCGPQKKAYKVSPAGMSILRTQFLYDNCCELKFIVKLAKTVRLIKTPCQCSCEHDRNLIILRQTDTCSRGEGT
jgi:hypothetical protein